MKKGRKFSQLRGKITIYLKMERKNHKLEEKLKTLLDM